MSLLSKEQKEIPRDSQRKWIVYRDSQIKTINVIYSGYWETAALSRKMAIMELTKKKALELLEQAATRKDQHY